MANVYGKAYHTVKAPQVSTTGKRNAEATFLNDMHTSHHHRTTNVYNICTERRDGKMVRKKSKTPKYMMPIGKAQYVCTSNSNTNVMETQVRHKIYTVQFYSYNF